MTDPVINEFIPNEVRCHFHIFDMSIITFWKWGFCLGFSNTPHVESLDRFRTFVVENFHNTIDNLKKNYYQEDKRYWNIPLDYFTPWHWVILQTVFISLFLINGAVMTNRLCIDLDYESNQTVMWRIYEDIRCPR